jgi:hypothetical protein
MVRGSEKAEFLSSNCTGTKRNTDMDLVRNNENVLFSKKSRLWADQLVRAVIQASSELRESLAVSTFSWSNYSVT